MFTRLARRQRKLLNSGQQIGDKKMCPTCAHPTTADGADPWTWLALMSGLLPQEWECKDYCTKEGLCGCNDPTHLRY